MTDLEKLVLRELAESIRDMDGYHDWDHLIEDGDMTMEDFERLPSILKRVRLTLEKQDGS